MCWLQYILNEKYIVQWKIPLISSIKLYNNTEKSDSCIRQHQTNMLTQVLFFDEGISNRKLLFINACRYIYAVAAVVVDMSTAITCYSTDARYVDIYL